MKNSIIDAQEELEIQQKLLFSKNYIEFLEDIVENQYPILTRWFGIDRRNRKIPLEILIEGITLKKL